MPLSPDRDGRPTIGRLRLMSSKELREVANYYKINAAKKKLPLATLRAAIIEALYGSIDQRRSGINDDVGTIAGLEEFEDIDDEDYEIKDDTTLELLKEFLSRPDAHEYVDYLKSRFPGSDNLVVEFEELVDMFCQLCHVADNNDMNIPKHIHQRWLKFRAKGQDKIANQIDNLYAVIAEAEEARDALEELLGPVNKSKVVRRIKVPRRVKK